MRPGGNILIAVAAHVFFHPRMLTYDFGPRHPFKPDRLVRTVALLQSVFPGVSLSDPGPGSLEETLRVHSPEFVEYVSLASSTNVNLPEKQWRFGFTEGDTPPFPGMLEATLAYGAGTVTAARKIVEGGSTAISMAGGLHHAKRSQASGFCIFDDVAIACDILREKFERVLYVDIDLHHGDGPESIFDAVREVATFSIHESGRTLYPGTGFTHDHGQAGTSFNLPLIAGTTGEVWAWAFREGFLSLMDWFRPQAIVLQMGCDAHFNDPLGHLQVSAQDWLSAVELVKSVNLPTVAAMGGGYSMASVPRMWTAAVLTWLGEPVPEHVPSQIPAEWQMTTFSDQNPPRNFGKEEALSAIEAHKRRFSSPY